MNTNNPPAFPTSDWDENDKAYKMHGMTLRDYFAAKALPPMMHADVGRWEGNHQRHAEQAYKYADAMLKAREQ